MGKLFAHLSLMLAVLVLNHIWKRCSAMLKYGGFCGKGCSTVVPQKLSQAGPVQALYCAKSFWYNLTHSVFTRPSVRAGVLAS